MPTNVERLLPPDAIARLHFIAEVCDVLRGWGRLDLSDAKPI